MSLVAAGLRSREFKTISSPGGLPRDVGGDRGIVMCLVREVLRMLLGAPPRTH